MNICVFLGSRMGKDDIYKEKVKELGCIIAKNNHTLVFGAANEGLMGVLAETVKDNGGYIIGIQAKMYSDPKYIFDRLDEYYVIDKVSARIDALLKLSDVCIAFPGGTGSLDEIAHTIEYIKSENRKKKLYIYNLNGYYFQLKKQLNLMIIEGFLDDDIYDNIKFISSFDEIDELTIV